MYSASGTHFASTGQASVAGQPTPPTTTVALMRATACRGCTVGARNQSQTGYNMQTQDFMGLELRV